MLDKHMRNLISLAMVVVLAAIFGFTTDNFFAWSNISNFLRGASYIGIIATGVTVAIVSGGNDLSTGSLVGLVATFTARLLYWGVPALLAILAACGLGLLCGLLTGTLITRLHLPDFITTLAMAYIYSGVILLISFREKGQIITRAITNRSFLALGKDIGGIFYVTIAWLAVVVAVQFLLKRTRFGTYAYAVGTNANSAMLSGISIVKTKCVAYAISGTCAAVAALFLIAYQGAAAPATGSAYTFDAVCAAVIGGAALTGGYGDAVGTALGCLFINLLTNGIYKFSLPSEYQLVAVGAVIIIMSVFNTLYMRHSNRRLRKTGGEEEREAAV